MGNGQWAQSIAPLQRNAMIFEDGEENLTFFGGEESRKVNCRILTFGNTRKIEESKEQFRGNIEQFHGNMRKAKILQVIDCHVVINTYTCIVKLAEEEHQEMHS